MPPLPPEKENREGVTRDTSNTIVIYAEDWNELLAYVQTLEQRIADLEQ